MLMPRALVLIAMATAAALAIGLPIGWGFSQFHSSAAPRHPQGMAASEARAQSECCQAPHPESFREKVTTDPVAFFTMLLCLITGGLAVYTGLLWGSTRKLVADAGQNAERQLRAYVGIDLIDLELPSITNAMYEIPDPVPNGHIFHDFVIAAAKNFGETPASKVAVFVNWASVTPFAGALPNDFPYGDLGSDNEIAGASRYILDPGKVHIAKVKIPKLQTFRDAQGKRCSLYFYGHIDSTDIFGRSWRRDFCYVYEPWRPTGDRFVPYREHNEEKKI